MRAPVPLLFLAVLHAASPGTVAAGEQPLPTSSGVEQLGVGWPKGQALPSQAPLSPDLLQRLGTLRMEDAVAISEQRNPTVREAYEQLLATQNSLGSAYATWWPTINQSFNGGIYGERAYYNYAGALTGIGSPATGPAAKATAFTGSYFQSLDQFDISWNLFDPQRTPTIWKNKYLVRQAADAYVIARRDNRLRTQEAYINLQSALATILTSQQLVANDQLLSQIAAARVRQGIASKLELAKQDTVLKADQVNLVLAKQTAQEAQASLAEQMSVIEAASIEPKVPLEPLGSWTHSLEATITSAMQYRKVIEQQLMAVKANEAQAQINLAVYRPTIALVNSLYWTKGAGYTSIGPPWQQAARSDLWNGSALLQISFTGFDGGQARMSAAAAMKQAKASEAAYQAAVNQVRRECQSYYAQTQQGREAVLLSAGRVKAASNALRLQSLRFNAGYGTVTDVVQAQQDLTQAVSSYIDVLSNYNIALVTLARVSGLAFQQDADLATAVGNPLDRLSLPNRLQRVR